MGTTIHEILAANTLLGVTDKIVGGLPNYHLPPGMLPDRGRPVQGNVGYIVRGDGANAHKAAKQAFRGSKSRPRTVSGMEQKPTVLIHSAENMAVKLDVLQGLLADDGTVAGQFSRSEVARMQREAATLSRNLRVAAVTSMLGIGHIYFNTDGELLPSSSGAVVDVDYSIPANNQNQLNGIIDVKWDTATAKIHKHVELIHEASLQASGRPIKYAIYGANVKSYLLANNYTKDQLTRNARVNDAMTAAVSGFDLFDIRWIPAYGGFFRDSSDAYQKLLANDKVIFLPEPDPSWFEMQEGFEMIPTAGFGTNGDLLSLLQNAAPRQGIFQYAYGNVDPMSATLVYGDNFLPALHVPEAVFIADVDF